MTDTSALFPGKHFISTVLDALETKTAMSGGLARVYLLRAAMAGGLIGVMYLASFAVLAAFAEVGNGDLIGIGRLVGALVFGFALVFIYYSKSELLTSNMMIVSIGAYYRRTTPLKSLRILLLCYGGNIIGGLAVALAIRPTLENLIGGFILYLDKPIRVGDFCTFGDSSGELQGLG